MTKKEYCRMMKSLSTYGITIILILIAVINYCFSLVQKNQLISQLDLDPSIINLDSLRNGIEEYNGFEFLFEFWFHSDFYFISIILLMLFVGVLLSFQLQQRKENAYGSLMVSRMGYKKYLNKIIVSQSLYIFSVITVTNILLLIIAFAFGGVGKYTSIIAMSLNWVQALIVIFAQTVYISVLAILINACSLLASTFIKNKYVLQAFPLVAFLLIPELITSTLGNISDFIGNIFLHYDILWQFNAINDIINDFVVNEAFSASLIFQYLISIITYFVLFIVLYIANVKKNESEYI